MSVKLVTSPEDLPKVNIRAQGAHVLIMIEPVKQASDIVFLVKSEFDKGVDLGEAWVLSAAKTYRGLPPKLLGTTKTPDYKDKNYVYEVPVQRGDKIAFRRFIRSQALLQGIDKALEQAQREWPDYEFLFIHVDDIYGVIQYADGRDIQNS